LKGKAKNINVATERSTPSNSEPLAYSPIKSIPPLPTTKKGDVGYALPLQEQLDSEQASYELALRLLAEEEAVFEEHRRLVQEATRVRVFDCVICMDKYPEDFAAPIKSCRHVLCRTCVKDHVQSQVEESMWPIRCPVCVADHSRTKGPGGEHPRTSLRAY
jgi:hypothetical protein